ncbi:hypothetical protein HKD37_08G020675 [Glycine soja]
MADTELSTACVDRLEAAMTKLAALQTSTTADQTSITSKLDAIIRILNTMVPKQPSPSSASAKSPPMPPLLSKTTNPTSSSAKPPPTVETTPPPPIAETTLPPLPMATSHLPVNKHHALSFESLPIASHRSHTKSSSRDILPSDIHFSLSVVCAATVRDTNLNHPFLLLIFVILVTAKGLCLHNHLQALILTPIFIWDPGSVFYTQHLEDKVFLMG